MTSSSARSLGGGLALLCLYGAIAAWWLRPVSWQLAHQVPGLPGASLADRLTLADVYRTLWILTAGAQQLLGDPTNLFHPPVFYPERYALAFADHMLGQQVLFLPTYVITGNPVLALNLSLLLSTALLALGTHLLIRRWGGGAAAAALGASLVIAAPWRVGLAAVRVHTLWVHYLPFIVLFLDRYLVERRRWCLALAATCLLLQILTSYYDGYATVIAVAVYLLARATTARARILQAGVGLLAAMGVAAACSYPYLLLARAGVVRQGPAAAVMLAFASLGAPAVLTRRVVGVAPAIGTLLLAIPWRGRDARRGDAPWGALLAIAAVGYVLAIGPALPVGRGLRSTLGLLWDFVTVSDPGRLVRILGERRDLHPVPTPYALLAATVPGFDQLRAPFRFGILPATILPITCALAIGRVASLLPAARWLAPLALSVIVVARIPSVIGTPVEVGSAVPPAYVWLRAHGRGLPLVEAPYRSGGTGALDNYDETRAMYFSTYHRLPLLNGHSGHMPSSFVARTHTAAQLPASAAVATLCAETGLGWILLHRERLPPRARRAWDETPAELRTAARFGEDEVFSVTCPAPPSHSTRSKMR